MASSDKNKPDNLTDNKVSWIRNTPIAHRGFHDVQKRIYENTLSAAKAAMENGYGIEVDLQPSSDTMPMVFHDYELDRMTGHSGNIRDVAYKELNNIKINNSEDTIPTLKQLLNLIQGRVDIILELKGLSGKDDGFVEAVVRDLEGYQGNIAIMSFEHHILKDARKIAPDLNLGLTAYGGEERYTENTKGVQNYDPDFISYEFKNLDTQFVREFVKTGKPIISWTVKSKQDAEYSARFVDQITFEGFKP